MPRLLQKLCCVVGVTVGVSLVVPPVASAEAEIVNLEHYYYDDLGWLVSPPRVDGNIIALFVGVSSTRPKPTCKSVVVNDATGRKVDSRTFRLGADGDEWFGEVKTKKLPNGSYTATVTCRDKDKALDTASVTVPVNNTVPQVISGTATCDNGSGVKSKPVSIYVRTEQVWGRWDYAKLGRVRGSESRTAVTYEFKARQAGNFRLSVECPGGSFYGTDHLNPGVHNIVATY